MSAPAAVETQPIAPKATAMQALFNPRTVALIGASEREGSVGRTLLENLLAGGGRKIFAVNAARESVLGLPAYHSISDVPEAVDLAVIATPAATVPEVAGECARAGVAAAIVISAGFKEIGQKGAELEKQIKAAMAGSAMRLIGPNCVGLMNPWKQLNATFINVLPRQGKVAMISQSGALLSAILDWSAQECLGFSSLVSCGSMLDLDWGDLIRHFGDDPHTRSILLYIESIPDPRSFVSAAREVALEKPIIALKPGRTEAASRAATSHTGALASNDAVLDAVLRRCGILRVERLADLFYMAEALGKQPRPRGPKLTIVTNAGGPGVLATDALITSGGELANLSPASLEKLSEFLPSHWSHANPVDVLGDADAEGFGRAVAIAAADPATDGLLAILAPQGMTSPTRVAEALCQQAKNARVPVLAAWMGGASIAESEAVLNAAGIPTFRYPDTAANVFERMSQYSLNLDALYETPERCALTDARRSNATELLAQIRNSGRTLLTEAEAKQVLACYEVPVTRTEIAATEEAAVAAAKDIGFPVVLKLHSQRITHKSDVGGVKLNLTSDAEVRSAFQQIAASVAAADFAGVTVQPLVPKDGFELILGSSTDTQFGPVILFGTGGELVEVYRDRALGLPPLNTTSARLLMQQTKIYKALGGVRGRKSADVGALQRLLVRFSQLVAEQPLIAEIDINPLHICDRHLVALDARIVLHDPKIAVEDLPRTAIRPYPAEYVAPWIARDHTEFVIRPVRPEDEPLMARFHAILSEDTVYERYFQVTNIAFRTSHQRLRRMCFAGYDRQIALVAETKDANGQPIITGVARLSKFNNGEGEFALVVGDPWQGKGIGSELLRRITDIGRREGLQAIRAIILRENLRMQRVARETGYTITPGDETTVEAYLACH
jgi:acetyltransferase